MISAVSLVTALAVTVGALLTVFDYNYNNITGNPDDLGFESVIDKKITNIDQRQVITKFYTKLVKLAVNSNDYPTLILNMLLLLKQLLLLQE